MPTHKNISNQYIEYHLNQLIRPPKIRNMKKNRKQPKSGSGVQTPMASEAFVEYSKIRGEAENIRDKQILREHELTILELKNLLLKKDIQLKVKTEQAKEIQKELAFLRSEKIKTGAAKEKFKKQRHEYLARIQELEDKVQKGREQASREVPRDRYDTCIRELDLLKTNIEDQEGRISRERDFYRQIFEEIKSLALSPQINGEQLKSSLIIMFEHLKQEKQQQIQ